jgi:hypothetical protein
VDRRAAQRLKRTFETEDPLENAFTLGGPGVGEDIALETFDFVVETIDDWKVRVDEPIEERVGDPRGATNPRSPSWSSRAFSPHGRRLQALEPRAHLARDVDQRSQQRGPRSIGPPDRDVAQLDAEVAQRPPHGGTEQERGGATGRPGDVEKTGRPFPCERQAEPTRDERPQRFSVEDLGSQVQHHAARADRRDDVVVQPRM